MAKGRTDPLAKPRSWGDWFYGFNQRAAAREARAETYRILLECELARMRGRKDAYAELERARLNPVGFLARLKTVLTGGRNGEG